MSDFTKPEYQGRSACGSVVVPFVAPPPSPTVNTFFEMCSDCGAVVMDRLAHTAHHARLYLAIEAAKKAQ